MPPRNQPYDVFKRIDMSAGPDECWPWIGGVGGISADMKAGEKSGKSKARPYFTVNGRKVMATRLVYELVKGVVLKVTEFILHSCDNSICCNPKHMSLGSHEDNMDEMVARDRHGMKHADVRRIRLLIMRGDMTRNEIASFMDTSIATIGRIARDEMHTHADDYPERKENGKDMGS